MSNLIDVEVNELVAGSHWIDDESDYERTDLKAHIKGDVEISISKFDAKSSVRKGFKTISITGCIEDGDKLRKVEFTLFTDRNADIKLDI